MAFSFVEKRNIIVIGRTGSGKSTLINQIIGIDLLTAKFSFSSVTKEIEQIAGRLVIDSQAYDVTFIDTVGINDGTSTDEKTNKRIISDMKTAITDRFTSGINLILVTLNLQQRLTAVDIAMFKLLESNFKSKFWKLSALIFTHCDLLNEGAISERKRDFITNQATKEIAAKFEDRIVTVGFPSLKDIKQEYKEKRKKEMKDDLKKVHDLIQKAKAIEPPKMLLQTASFRE